METLAEQPINYVHTELNREHRHRTDTATWLAETLNGSMRTHFEFSYDGADFIGEDGGSASEIFNSAIEVARLMVRENPSLMFELRRRLIERRELDDMHAMVKGDLPNTMITISDFPPELMDANEDVGGYNIRRQQTMLRVITHEEDGKIHVTTQSLDGSNRQALEAIYKTMSEVAEPGELLSQKMYCSLPSRWQPQLINNLTTVYDRELSTQFGGQWHAGIPKSLNPNVVDTYEFAESQHDLIEWFTSEKMADSTGAEKLRYKLAATVAERYEAHLRFLAGKSHEITGNPKTNINAMPYISPTRAIFGYQKNLQQEMNGASRRASASGKSFSGCGASVKAVNDNYSTEDQLSGAGYGNKAGEKAKIPQTIKCPECKQPSPKEKVIKKDTWCCPNCKYEINVCDGSVKHVSEKNKKEKRRAL